VRAAAKTRPLPVLGRSGPRRWSSRGAPAFALLLALVAGWAVETAAAAQGRPEIPPAPARWVTDQAGVLSRAAATAVDRKLEEFERQQGTQILVYIARRLPEGEVLEDWTQRVAEAWRVGRAGKDDGAVLFVFVDDRALRLEVGYGLEGALTDLESKAILDEVLIPHLRAGDWDGGIAAAADAIVEAVRGEFRPDRDASGRRRGRPAPIPFGLILFMVILFVVLMSIAARRGGRRGGGFRGGGFGGFGGGGFGGGGFGGGGFGGGGFSGGGGSFGGGGASGRW